MEPYCGYKALDGSLHSTIKDCEKADLEYKIKDLLGKIQNINSSIYNMLYKYTASFHSAVSDFNVIQDILERLFSERGNEIFKILELIKKHEEEIIKLREHEDYKKRWWTKLKWW